MEAIRGEQAMLQRRLSEQEHEPRGMQHNVFQSSPQGISSKPPKFPSSATKASSWVKRMSLFLQAQGLGYTIQHNPNPVPVISDTDRVRLVLRHGEQTVRDHERAWCFLLEATSDAPFEDRLLACKTLEEAWWIVAQWHMPATDSEKELLTDQLDNARMGTDEDPKLFFARVDGIINTLRSAGITKEEREVTRIIIRNLPEEYDVERRGVLLKPDITRIEVEEIVRTRHAALQRSKRGSQFPAADPHALAAGSGYRGGGGRFPRPGRGGRTQTYGRGQGWGNFTPHQFHHQQHPRSPPQQQFQQQYHNQRRQQLHSQRPDCGIGGPFDNGSNAVWDQKESPPPPNAPMGSVLDVEGAAN